MAAEDKFWFWLDIFSIVDFFTIPPSILSYYVNRHWIGLRFLRVFRLMNIPDILQYLNMLNTTGSIRLTQMLTMFVTIWLSSAGFIHLVENSGDQLDPLSSFHSMSYFDCLYFLIMYVLFFILFTSILIHGNN